MLIREFIAHSSAVFALIKEQSKVSNEVRKEHISSLFANMRTLANATDGDKTNAVNLLGVDLAARGWKKNSIKVVRSEFLRIWDNIGHVPQDCTSWKKALSAIRSATTGEGLILIENMLAAQEAIEAAQKRLADLYAEWRDLSLDVANDITFSDEHQSTDRQLRAA